MKSKKSKNKKMNEKKKKKKKTPEKQKQKPNYYKTTAKNQMFKNSKEVWESLTMNYKFWISVILSVGLITHFGTKGYSFVESFISFLLAILVGYCVHYISHAYDFDRLYEESDWTILKWVRSNPTSNKIMKRIILYTFDFHDKIHHNSKINKTSLNVIIEFFQNIFTEGGLLILLVLATNFKLELFGWTFRFNKAVLLLWGMLYASVHNINYLFHGNSQHTNHHKDPKTNYALDILDILFDTKYDLNNIENINLNWGFNILIITFFIIYFKIYM